MKWLSLLILVLFAACASSSGGNPKRVASGSSEKISEENPGIYEPNMHRTYHDKRYENDPAFEKYYKWKKN